MSTRQNHELTADSWLSIIASAYRLLEDATARGFGVPPFSLGGGTVLMFRFRHRLSKDVDFFGYDAQWLSLFSPRLNEVAAGLAQDYAEAANSLKIVMPHGDIDFVIAADIAIPVERRLENVAGRTLLVDPVSEILAKKLFYRAASLKPRDIYDMSAAIDLDPLSAIRAAQAARSKMPVLLRRLAEFEVGDPQELLRDIVPYNGSLQHADAMVLKTRAFLEEHM